MEKWIQSLVTSRSDRERFEYHSFLLRLWQVMEDGKPIWRFSLEDPVSGERIGFNRLGELVDFLVSTVCRGDIQQST
jgi:hypothetical protein